jgi:hypothetical protein
MTAQAFFDALGDILIEQAPDGFVPLTTESGPVGADGTEPGGGRSGFLPLLQALGLRGGFLRIWESPRRAGRALAVVYVLGSPAAAQDFIRWARGIPTLANHVRARPTEIAGAVSCIEPGGCFVAFAQEDRFFWLMADRFDPTQLEDAIRIEEELAARQCNKLT